MAKSAPKLPVGIHTFDPAYPLAKIKDNPLNWRKHPPGQRQALNAAIQAVGYADAAIINTTTGHLVDGHMRVDEARKRGDKTIPALLGTWTVEQERQILLTKDPLAAMAQTNAEALSALADTQSKMLDKFQGEHKKNLERLHKGLESYALRVEAGEEEATPLNIAAQTRKRKQVESTSQIEVDADEEMLDPETGIYETSLKEDVIFPTDDVWGIPALKSEMLCTDAPSVTWDRSDETLSPESYYCYSAGPSTLPSPEKGNRNAGEGFLGFFTEDFRFAKCWNDSATFLHYLQGMEFRGAIAPDFSDWASWPAVVRLHNIYRSRWCARYWQEGGIPVIPILQSCGDIDVFADQIFGTLPTHVPVAAVQCRTREKGTSFWKGFGAFLSVCCESLKIDKLIIYGGIENRKYLEPRLPSGRRAPNDIILLESFVSRRRKGHDRRKALVAASNSI